MNMAEVNFKESAQRHWKDAQNLKALGETANVGQLLGFSAECGLKALYQSFLLPCGTNGDIDWGSMPKPEKDKYRVHIDKLCSTSSVIAASPTMAKYASLIPSINDFASWHTDQRYWSDVEHSRTCVLEIPKWENAAQEVLKMLDAAKQDGVL